MKKVFAASMLLMVILAACAPSQATSTDSNTGTTGDTGQVQNPPVAGATNTEQAPVVVALTATANINLNCRIGPNTAFEVAQVVDQGTSAMVIGKYTTADPDWYQLQLADGSQCWADSENLTLSGSAASVAEVQSPPTPTPLPLTYYWVGTWTIWQNECTSNALSCEQIVSATFTATGPNTIVATYAAIGCNWQDTLTVTSDGMFANGINKCTNTGATWEAHLKMDPNHNQFRGKWNIQGNTAQDGYYAGVRNGYGKPDPTR